MTSKAGSPGQSAMLKVKVVPGASQSEICGWLGDMLKVRVTSQPEKGNANSAVVALLSRTLGVSKKSISITSGKTSQKKVVEIHGLSMTQLKQKFGDSGA